MTSQEPAYQGYRFPPEIISYAVWLYYRFSLSFRDVEDLLAQRGVEVSYETIRQWCGKFGPGYAARVKRRQGRAGNTWHLDEVFITIRGQRHYLWRAVDQDGDVIDILVQRRRNGRAANAAVQIRGSSAAVLVSARSNPESLSYRTSPAASSLPPNPSNARYPCLA